MRRRSTRLAAVLIGAVACTAGPVMLPVETAPAAPDPCPERSVRAEVVDNPSVAEPRVLGRSWIPATDSDRIRWFDPVTLRVRSGYHALPEQTGIWAVSPDGELVAISLRSSVRVIDTRTLRTVASLRRLAGADRLSWISDDVLAGLDGSDAFAWDRRSHGVRRHDVGGTAVATFAASDRLLLVTGGRDEPTPRLIEVGIQGFRSVSLDRIEGFDPDRGPLGIELVPGLAYDPAGRQAYVVPPEGPIAQVDLRAGRVDPAAVVRYRTPPASFIERISSSLLPVAEAKMGEWETVRAVWLGDSLLAVSGSTGSTMGAGGTAAGVSILDTETWTACLLEAGPTYVAVSDGVLLAWGGAEFGEFGGTGLIGYDLRDGDRWHRFGRQYLDIQLYGPYGYAINSWHGWRVRTLDLSNGNVIARHRGRPPTVLPTGASAAW